MKHLLLGFSCIITTTLFAQKILRGKLLAAADKQPVVAASVFVSNTNIGTASQEDGSFSLPTFPEGEHYLVITSTDYEPRVVAVNFDLLSDTLTITLNRKVGKINKVTVGGFVDKGWDTWGHFFMANLMGQTPNAQDCKLSNKEAVQFRIGQLNQYQQVLEVIATQPLIIENNALGYVITYDLEFFEMKLLVGSPSPGNLTYKGHPSFKEMQAPDEATQQKWFRNRQEAYKGSMMHFMRSLYRNQLATEGFSVRRIANLFDTIQAGKEIYLTGDSIAYAIDSNKVQLQFTGSIEIIYSAKQVTEAYVTAATYPAVSPKAYMDIPDVGKIKIDQITVANLPASVAIGQPITARMKFRRRSEPVQILYNGFYSPSENLMLKLYWDWSEKLSNLLPFDYGNPEPVNAEQIYKPQ